jgi:hypothetical protein
MSFHEDKLELAKKSVNMLSRIEKEKDVRDILINHANLVNVSGKTNLEAVLESFTELATKAESEQVRSQTATQYLKFLAKPQDEEGSRGGQLMNLQININPVKGETIIE